MAAKLILKSSILILMILVSLAVIAKLGHFDQDFYYYAIVDKHNMLMTTKSPRLILVGGSNVGFGLNSERIKEQLEINVINMGAAADIGLRYMLEEVKGNIREGDVLIVCPEYYQFNKYFNGGAGLLYLLDVYPAGIKNFTSYKQYYNAIENVPQFLNRRLLAILREMMGRQRPHRRGGRHGFNEFGDFIYHLGKESEDISQMSIFSRGTTDLIEPEAIEAINNIYEHARKQNAQAFFYFPSIPILHYERNMDEIENIHQQLRRQLLIPIINEPYDQVFPLDYFYDSPYHPNAKGRQVRTEKFIDEMRKALYPDNLAAAPGDSVD
ncbi:MAG: hypothetical protein GF315_11210 [candidate division Zixibacteria bacterium]|nr:hypothetical protein [candidate division Zixibacteria bacterium]